METPNNRAELIDNLNFCIALSDPFTRITVGTEWKVSSTARMVALTQNNFRTLPHTLVIEECA